MEIQYLHKYVHLESQSTMSYSASLLVKSDNTALWNYFRNDRLLDWLTKLTSFKTGFLYAQPTKLKSYGSIQDHVYIHFSIHYTDD